MTRPIRLPLAAALAAAVAAGLAPAAQAQSTEVVADGLANPRGITLGPDGRLYVAEAGTGGDGACQGSPEGEGEECVGATGAVTRIDPGSGAKRTVVGGLPSLAAQEGEDPGGAATGPHDVSFNGRSMWFTVGLAGDSARRAGYGDAGAGLGKVYRRGPLGRTQPVADLVAYEEANDPDAGQPGVEGPDSNAYGVDASGPNALVTDAGGNDLLRVTPGGTVSTVAVFGFSQADAPPFLGLPPGTKLPVQPVPTGLARGPLGTTYVAQLTGFPFPAGGAELARVGLAGNVATSVRGQTNLIDVALGPDGSRYVLSLTAGGLLSDDITGKLTRYPVFGPPQELAAGELLAPGGVTVADDGDVYVTNLSISGGGGQVLRIRP